MAEQYRRIYKYTGQGNYAGPRSVNWSRFSVSGDTGRTIGQIVSIVYEHYHTYTAGGSRTLRGRITLADGTTFISEPDAHAFAGNVVRFTNSFTELPTAEQFAQIAKIETINEKGGNSNAGYSQYIYWRATAEHPMRVIVTFVEEPPVHYAPRVEKFIVGRCNAQGTMADDGAYIKTTLKLGIGDAAGLSDGMSARIYYRADGAPTTADSYVDLTGRVSELIAGVSFDASILPGQWELGSAWHFALVFVTGKESAVGTDSVGNAFAPLFVSLDGKRISAGGFPKQSSGTSFEVFPPAHLYGGVAQIGGGWTLLTPLAGSTPADYGGGALRCRAIEDLRIVDGSVLVNPGSGVVLAALPEGYTPVKNVLSINACAGGRVARISVGGVSDANAGKIAIDWVRNLSDGSTYTGAAIWVQCSIMYWVN